MIAQYLTTKGSRTGEVVKRNAHTVWVRLGERIIKRHLRKHQVTIHE